ncbi:MAG TPA: TRAP transporter small permease [Pseudolabrys sp.]|nr:TRAP transporter small permease [Pseudolabrys sp.]
MLRRLHRTIDRGFRRVETAAAILAGFMMIAMMVLVSADALLRRGFGQPLTFQLTLSESYLIVAMVMLSLAWGFRRGGTIQVRLLLDILPERAANVITRAGLAASSIYMIVLAMRAWSPFYRAWIDNEVTMGVIDWPVAWSWIWVPLGCAMLALRLALDATAPVLAVADNHAGEPTGTEIL